MSVIKVNKTKDYTIMSNYHFKERNMSLKAKGLLSLMLSLPADWDYSIAGLVAICKENETAIKSTLDELKQFGYLEVIKHIPTKENGGRIEYEYIVYEQKIHKINTNEIEVKVGKDLIQGIEKQGIENLGVEVLEVENPIQYNTNNKELKNKKLNNIKEQQCILDSFEFSDKVKTSIDTWLQYKKEKGQTYKPSGLTALCKKLEQMIKENSENYLIQAINYSMSQNYSGIFAEKSYLNEKPIIKQAEIPNKERLNSLFSNIINVEV